MNNRNKNSQKVIDWRNRTKERITQSFGNVCGICGYNKCNHALELHHLDPFKKEFGLGSIRASPISWDRIVIELRKCVMLCSNCHKEYHAGLFEIPENITRFDETFSNYLKLKEEDRKRKYYNPCPICGTEKFHTQKTCSYKCAAKIVGQYDWDKFDLKNLYFDQKQNMCQIARLIGCSSNAIKKRMLKLKLI